jgi:hypothetical protein
MAARAEVKEETLKPDPASIQEHDLAWHSFIDTSNSIYFFQKTNIYLQNNNEPRSTSQEHITS